MTDGIGRIFGSNYGINSYVNNKKGEEPKNETTEAPVVREEKQVDEEKVFEFLNKYNIFTPEVKTSEIKGVDKETEERINGYMDEFENIYGAIEQEFGPKIAPFAMNLVMDKLMVMA